MEIPTSRGNVAIAALLLVVGVGIAAVTFDSLRTTSQPIVVIQPESQIALAATEPMPKDKGACGQFKGNWVCEKDSQSYTCEVGFDYIVKLIDGKDPGSTVTKKIAITFGTINDKDPRLFSDSNQCPNGIEPMRLVDARANNDILPSRMIPQRFCKKPDPAVPIKPGENPTAWQCYVTFCQPKGWTGADLKEEVCKTIPQGKNPGENMNVSEITAPMQNSLSQFIMDPNVPEEQKVPLREQYGLPSTMGQGVNDAFKEQQRTDLTTELGTLDKQIEYNKETLRLMAECSECTDAEKADKLQEIKEQEERAAKLREQLKLLDEGKVVTPAPGVPEVKPPPGKVDPPPRRETFDERSPTPCSSGNCNGNQSLGGGNLFGSIGQFLPLLLGLASGYMQQAPTCSISASPTSIQQPGQPVTLTWQSQGAQSASFSWQGPAGPSGSSVVNPQQTTTYTMQVIGYPPQGQQQYNPYGQQQYNPYGQQQYNPYGGYGGYQQQDPYCVTSQYPLMYTQQPAVPGCLNYRQVGYGGYGMQQQQNPYMQLGQTLGQLLGGGSGGQQQAQCSTQVTVGGSGTSTSASLKAMISCQPKIADVGMQIGVSYACQGANTSKGEGFSTNNELSGNAQATAVVPTVGSTNNTYSLTCAKEGATDTAQCTIGVNKPSIALVSIPKNIKSGEAATIGWVTGAMESCVISSPTLSQFTEQNKNNAATSGSTRTPALTQDTKFVLTCVTKAGGTKTAEETVKVGPAH